MTIELTVTHIAVIMWAVGFQRWVGLAGEKLNYGEDNPTLL
jgi:hypothetical protein